jgi:hypothetical protein
MIRKDYSASDNMQNPIVNPSWTTNTATFGNDQSLTTNTAIYYSAADINT